MRLTQMMAGHFQVDCFAQTQTLQGKTEWTLSLTQQPVN